MDYLPVVESSLRWRWQSRPFGVCQNPQSGTLQSLTYKIESPDTVDNRWTEAWIWNAVVQSKYKRQYNLSCQPQSTSPPPSRKPLRCLYFWKRKYPGNRALCQRMRQQIHLASSVTKQPTKLPLKTPAQKATMSTSRNINWCWRNFVQLGNRRNGFRKQQLPQQ